MCGRLLIECQMGEKLFLFLFAGSGGMFVKIGNEKMKV